MPDASLLFRIIYATCCSSTHHKLALDGLLHLRGRFAERWRNLILTHYEAYLEGSKAPDSKFRDFRNHVLHVNDDFWGGAVESTQEWYARTVEMLKMSEWEEAAYAAGVLSHYYTDPVMPLHTAQSKEETVIHRACEWSIAQSYDAIRDIIRARIGFPDLEPGEGAEWLAQMVRDGAIFSNQYYDTLVRNYDFAKGASDPPAGLDRELRDMLAKVLAYAATGWSRILERAIDESEARPPRTNPTVQAFFTTLKVPIHYITKRLTEENERAIVVAMYEELSETGALEEMLAGEQRTIRRLYEEQVAAPRRKQEAALRRRGVKVEPRQKPAVAANAHDPVFLPVQSGNAEAGNAMRNRIATGVAGEEEEQDSRQRRRDSTQRRRDSAPHPGARNHSDSGDKPASEHTSSRTTTEPETEPRSAPGKWTVTTPATAYQPPQQPTGEDARTSQKTTQKAASDDPFDIDLDDQSGLSLHAPDDTTHAVSSKYTPQRAPEYGPQRKPQHQPQRKPQRDALRFYLERTADVEAAPSIGKKTAKRLSKVGVRTVEQLLSADPESTSSRLNVRHIQPETIIEWQQQAMLVCRIPNLRGHDAQLMVGSGYTSPESVAEADSHELLSLVEDFAGTHEGQRVIRGGSAPDLDEVNNWIAWAAQARSLNAA